MKTDLNHYPSFITCLSLVIILLAWLFVTCSCAKVEPGIPFPGILLIDTPPDAQPSAPGSIVHYSCRFGDGETGLERGWSKDYPGITYPSTTYQGWGQGFDSAFQVIENMEQFMLRSPMMDIAAGPHTISLRWKSNIPVRVVDRYTPTCGTTIAMLPAVTCPHDTCVPFKSAVKQLLFYNSPWPGSHFEVDNVEIK